MEGILFTYFLPKRLVNCPTVFIEVNPVPIALKHPFITHKLSHMMCLALFLYFFFFLLLLFCLVVVVVVLVMPRGMWDLSSPSRDHTHVSCSGRVEI